MYIYYVIFRCFPREEIPILTWTSGTRYEELSEEKKNIITARKEAVTKILRNKGCCIDVVAEILEFDFDSITLRYEC